MSGGIGYRLAMLIKEFGITNYVLAKETGVTDSTISRIINKDQKPQSTTSKAIADYFKVSEKWFLTGEGSREPVNFLEDEEYVERVSGKVIEKLGPFLQGFAKSHDQLLREIAKIMLDLDDAEDEREEMKEGLKRIESMLNETKNKIENL